MRAVNMTEPSVVDMATARRPPSRKNHSLAEYALTQCEHAYFCKDWARFDYWFRVYRDARLRASDERPNTASHTPSNRIQDLRPKMACRANNPPSEATDFSACLAKVAAALLLLTVAAPSPAKTMSYSSSDKATVIASTTLPDVTAVPLYVKLIGGRLSPDTVSGVSTGSGFFYQLSGTTEISVDDKTTMIAAGDATFIPGGAKIALKAADHEPSIYLEFLLSPAGYSDLPEVTAANGHEIYRSSSSIRDLHGGNYVLNLTRVTLPRQAPPDMPHHRSAAALHVVLSGVGAETADGTTVVRSPGSVSFEPASLVYQWRNPSDLPLTYLVFNLNGEAEDAVVTVAQRGPRR
jgi:mannose-6-phosphate isomerase-like protein (cupin superfamily)